MIQSAQLFGHYPHVFACNLVVEKSSLIHQTVLSRNGKGKIGISVLILSGNPTCYFPQLTLFPSGGD